MLLCYFTGYVYADDTLNTEPLPTPEPQEPSIPKLLYYYYDESTQAQVSTEDAQTFATNISSADTIEVTIELAYCAPECTCFSSLPVHATDEEVDAARNTHNDHSKRFHTAINQQLIDDTNFVQNSSDYKLIVSSYSPFIQLVFEGYANYSRTVQQITSLTTDDRIFTISIYALYSQHENANEPQANISSQYEQYPIADAIDDINASDQTYDGEGVRVGILESAGITSAPSHPELSHLTITSATFYPFNDHATLVARVLCGAYGVAPGIESAHVYNRSTGSLIEGLEWMANSNVDIVNSSGFDHNEDYGIYTTSSRQIDYFIEHYRITFVNASGYRWNPVFQHEVVSYAMANNAISVGALNADNTVWACSSYGCASGESRRKPTISAPGTNIKISNSDTQPESGTSIAAPMVSGVIAKLMDEFPILKCHPELVMAALVVSASPVNGQTDIWDPHAGAGRVDYEKAREALSNYILFEGPQNSIGLCTSQQISIEPNQSVKVVFFCLANIADPDDNTALPYGYTNYDLVIANTSGNELVASRSYYNTEILSYQNYVYEAVNIQIYQTYYKQYTTTDIGALIWIYE